MISYALNKLHNISRPGEDPTEGDIIEVECVGGFIKEVDPITQTCRESRQRFILGADGALTITRLGKE